jgi:hypothetical protein
MFWPCSTGEAVKWKVIVELLLLSVAAFAGIPLHVKSLGCRVAGSTGPLALITKSVSWVWTSMPQAEPLTVQGGEPLGVGVAVAVGVGVGVGPAMHAPETVIP